VTDVMQGVRVLEVAEHTFVPAASALLADWGAEVIKVERGDAMRGLMSSGLALMSTDVHVLLEHSNRGKRSIGLDLSTPEGLEVLGRIAATCDVFLTNKLPGVRKKLGIDLEQVRAHNPNIIYVRGSGQGDRGPDADKGSYDVLSFWHRSGMAVGEQQPDAEKVPTPPAPAFGDSIGGMTIAGAVMGALFHRERTGEATVVDVSLLGVGLWSMGAGLALSLQMGRPWVQPPSSASRNPLSATYQAKDGTAVALSCLQAARYWGELVALLGRPELATDERFADHQSLADHAGAASDEIAAAIGACDAAEWPVDDRAGHARRGRGSTDRREWLHRRLRDRCRCAVPAGGSARAVRRGPSPGASRSGVQRARRRHPRRGRLRLGHDRRPEGQRCRRLIGPASGRRIGRRRRRRAHRRDDRA
jgi:crotonobetainyl-CoA:carnitine CoA-transferase CaiB-like acyl-CoA transferase